MSDPVNKWDQPELAPPPMFFGQKERDLVKQVNDELAERVVGQTIAYYAVSLEDSEYHPIYGEAIDKVTLPPVRVYAYVTVENEQTNERYGYEYQTKLTVNFNRKRLTEDQNLFVRVGDFVQYGDEFYEVVKTYNDTRYYFGQIEHKFQISAECIKARRGTFRIRGEMKPQLVTTGPGAKAAVQPAPAPAPVIPRAPNNAQYVVLQATDGLTKERVLTAGSNITLTDGGAGGVLTIAATGDLAPSGSELVYSSTGVESSGYLKVTGSTTLQGAISSSAGAHWVGSLSSSGDIAITGAMHATTYYGDGSNLAGVGSNASGSARQYSGTGIETSGYLKVTGSTTLANSLSSSAGAVWGSSVSSSGDLAITGALHAATLYGDGSGLSGVLTSMSGTARQYSATGVETSGYLKVTGSTTLASAMSSAAGGTFVGSVSSSGDMAVTGNMHAVAYYGDGSNLSGIGSNASGSARHYSATGFESSGYLKVTGSTTLTGDLSSSAAAQVVGNSILGGTLNISGAITAASIASGTLAGSGSFVGLNSSNQLVLTGAGEPVSGAIRHYSVTGLETSGYLKVTGSSTLGGAMSSSAGAVLVGSVSSSGDLAVTGNVHAAAYYGDGSNLAGVSDASGSGRHYSSTGLETSGYLKVTGSTTLQDLLSSSAGAMFRGNTAFAGTVEATGNLSASAGNFEGLTGTSLNLQNGGVSNAGALAGVTTATLSGLLSSSAAAQVVGASILGGALNVSGTITAASIASGTLAGSGSFIGLNSSNQFVLTGAGEPVSGAIRHYSATGLETAGYLKVTGSTTLGGAVSSSAGAVLVGSVSSSGDLAVTGNMHAAAYYGDGSNLTGISSTASGSARHYSVTGVETSGYLKVTGSTTLAGDVSSSAAARLVGSISSSGDLAVTGNVHADAYFGDGSNLTGVAGSASGSARHYSATGVETSGYLKVTGSTTLGGAVSSSAGAVYVSSISSSGDLAVTGNIHAALYFGDGSNLTGVGSSASGSARHYSVTGLETSGYLKVTGSTTLGGAVSSSAGAVYVSSVSSSGDMAVTGNVHATTYYGDGSSLTGIGASSASGSARHYSTTGVETSGYLKVTGSTTLAGTLSSSAAATWVGSLSSSANMAVTGNMHATTYYGDGSNLTGIGSAAASGSALHYSATGMITSGYLKVSGSSNFAGGITHNVTTVTAATYTLLETDYYIAADTTSNAITLTLPNACVDIAGHTYVIKDVAGTAAANAITVDGYQAETIDGNGTVDIDSPYGAVNLFTDGSAWFIY